MFVRACLLCVIGFGAIAFAPSVRAQSCGNHDNLHGLPCGVHAASSPVAQQLSLASTLQRSVDISHRPQGPTHVDIAIACPAGQVALAAGLDGRLALAGLDGQTHYAPSGAMAPTFRGVRLAALADGIHDAPDGWIASAQHDWDFGVPLRSTLSVVCAPIANVVAVVASTSPAPAGYHHDTASAFCPAGLVALGGGADGSDVEVSWLQSMRPAFAPGEPALASRPPGVDAAPTGWSATRSSAVAGVTKVAVICAAAPGALTMVSAPSATNVALSCPSDTIALGGGVGSIAPQLAVYASTPTYAGPPAFPGARADGRYPAAAGWYANGEVIGVKADLVAGVVCVAALAAPPLVQVNVIEFHHAGLDHYFRTADAAEAAAVDTGAAGPGWLRTSDDFSAFAAGTSAPSVDVCRFYTSVANSHFYTAFADECAVLQMPASGWSFEGIAFGIQLPPPAGGCPLGTVPVYRLYNDRAAFNDSNHRFTTLAANVVSMVAKRWVSEGVAFCTANAEPH